MAVCLGLLHISGVFHPSVRQENDQKARQHPHIALRKKLAAIIELNTGDELQ